MKLKPSQLLPVAALFVLSTAAQAQGPGGGGLGGFQIPPAMQAKFKAWQHWRDNHKTRPYAQKDVSFEEYQPAYRAGVESYNRNPGRSFDEVEPELGSDWSRARGNSSLEWEHARPAARDAWDRVSNATERAIPGDSDKDGR